MRKVIACAGLVVGVVCATSGITSMSPAHVSAQQAAAMEPDQISAPLLLDLKAGTLRSDLAAAGSGVLGRRSNGNVLGIDSLQNFSSYFYFPGVIDQFGDPQFTWPYTMVGRAPFGQGDDNSERTTSIPAPVVPVNIDLRDKNGAPRFTATGQPLVSSATKFVDPVLKSPVFARTTFDSSERPTQFADAVHRAQFFNMADDDWHTILRPAVKTSRTMVLRQSADPTKLTYTFTLNADGTCCKAVFININAFLTALFPPNPTDTTTPVGAAENAHDIRTSDLSTFLFPNTFLFFPGFPATPGTCCVVGFHTYDLEPGDAGNGWRERRYVLNYSSWVSPGIFRDPTFGDISALSHEVSETFNDPFVNNATPFWLAPNGLCQNNLESGDVIEGLHNAQFPIFLNGFTYHPQNEALLQWFAGQTPSNAIHHAYSYPDTTVLTSAATSQPFNCKP